MRKLKIGIIGMGGIATRAHIPTLLAHDDVEEIVGADLNEDQRNRTQSRFNIKKAYPTFEEMLQNSQLDAVYVCLPNQLHLSAVSQAIERGLHVYCEKPVGLCAKELSTLVTKANSNNLIFMPGYNRRFKKNYMQAKEMVDSKMLGRLVHIQAASFTPGPYVGWDPKSDWYYQPENVGVLYDQGSHIIDMIHFISKQNWETVFAGYSSSLEGLELSDNISITAKNAKTICSISIGWNAGRYYDSITLFGTAGILHVTPDSFEHISPNSAGADKLTYFLKHILNICKNQIRQFRSSLPSDPDYVAINDHFIKSILGSEKPTLFAEDGLRVLEILDAAKQSLKNQTVSPCRTITVPN